MRLSWDEPELPRRRKGDPQKVKLAGRLRRETTLSWKWIAQQLPMGSWTCVSNLPNEKSRPRCVNREDSCLALARVVEIVHRTKAEDKP
jgi:phosphodiesterase/alkaline phosphatase D-like protein